MDWMPIETIWSTISGHFRSPARDSRSTSPMRRNTPPASSRSRRRTLCGSRATMGSRADSTASAADSPGFRSDTRLRDAAQGVEPRALGEERQLDRARGPVALLGDDDLGLAVALGRVGLVRVGAVDEEDEVAVLLDRARFPQVRQHRALAAAARLDRA